MRVLITGVSGFIGQHAYRLLAEKYDVFGVTRTPISTHPMHVDRLIFADLGKHAFDELLPPNIDCVIHLAQSQQYRNFPEGADDMRRINIDATCKLLEWARKTSVKQFVLASTANVYGKSATKLTESNATQPDSFYGASKLAAEHLAKKYNEFFQVDILRLFTVYGPGQNGMLISNIIDRIKNNQPVTLAKGAGLYLTPIYVGDVVAAIAKLVEAPAKTSVRVLNVCGDKVTHLGEIVQTLEVAMGVQARTQLTDEVAQYFTGDNTALKAALDWQQLTDLATGLAFTADNSRLIHIQS